MAHHCWRTWKWPFTPHRIKFIFFIESFSLWKLLHLIWTELIHFIKSFSLWEFFSMGTFGPNLFTFKGSLRTEVIHFIKSYSLEHVSLLKVFLYGSFYFSSGPNLFILLKVFLLPSTHFKINSFTFQISKNTFSLFSFSSFVSKKVFKFSICTTNGTLTMNPNTNRFEPAAASLFLSLSFIPNPNPKTVTLRSFF